MKSVMERRIINGAKYSQADRAAATLSQAFLTEKYEAARQLFVIIWRLKLITDPKWSKRPFGSYYYADKLTQCHTFGKYDGTNTERGAHEFDPNSICTVPAWFSESFQVDVH